MTSHPNSRKHIPASMANLARRRRGGVPKDPAVRQARAKRGGKASGEARHRRIREQLQDADAVTAFYRGYRRGYNLAMKRWKAYADRVIQQAFRKAGNAA